MIAEVIQGKLLPRDSLREALELPERGAVRVAVTGAGGKTSTVKRLAREYALLGARPLVLTTTHMYVEDSPLFLYHPQSLEEIQTALVEKGCLFVGEKTDRGRMKNVSEEMFRQIMELDNPVLTEADGARRLPVKMPGEQEPVVPEQTGLLVWVCGLDALGHPLEEVCFRAELAAEFLGKSQRDILTPEDVARLALSPLAGQKGRGEQMDYAVVLNKGDTGERCRQALEVVQCMERLEENQQKKTPVFVTAKEEHADEDFNPWSR